MPIYEPLPLVFAAFLLYLAFYSMSIKLMEIFLCSK